MSRTSDDIRKHLKVRRQKQRAILAMRWRCAQGGLEFEQLDTFYGAIRPYLCVAQFFGIMPLSNIRSRDPQDVKFKVRSIGLAVTGLFLLLGGMKTLVGANILFTEGLNAKNIVGLVFLIVGMVNWLNFVGFARSWSHIMLPWSSVDILMLFPPYKRGKRSLRSKVNVLALSVVVLAVGDHMLYYASGYCSYSMHILQCHTNHSRITFGLYLEKEFSDIMFIMPFNIFSMCYGFWLNGAFTFLWNFMDIFIVMTSIGLAQRFQQFAARVGALEGRHVPEALWYDIRRDHIRLCELASLVEASMSNIVFVSCANNVYVICNQALAIFTKLRHPINYVYFWYSLIFLLARTSLVFMTASKIHDASLLPLRSLYLVPSDGWTQEVQRFADQLTSEFVGLSGYRLFCLTRKSLFGMLATLVTYELMLLQIDAKSHKGLRCA
uniref:Gustatory receptor for sugar taste 61a n=2 Tax=Drosophila melanogaster TaxID=7227 RepID=GR61A_DROME|nr:gustatory receptor 61a, isoform B [Drosophila melanogaster]NP_523877.1 gustatory receptor 61a, isoform A [Drosophila melanogaster]Q9W0M2.2 RecName: Full=Gustatory receptor for sugar taste 61a [Drosophila melanogaster]AAF47421.2 gustatory receptor 61a, isoform A [Drosophila melanogaster]AGB93921.1 gustatory receptor 61a, isoform B [Drosophila melanogaster]|eukprot:NP_001261226.1 gustatory receptor 61a, isoform B [Drosophila melanogaster]